MVEEDFWHNTQRSDPRLVEKIQYSCTTNPVFGGKWDEHAMQSAEKHYRWPLIVKRYEELWGEDQYRWQKWRRGEGRIIEAVIRLSLEKSLATLYGKRDPHAQVVHNVRGTRRDETARSILFSVHIVRFPNSAKIFNLMLRDSTLSIQASRLRKVVETVGKEVDQVRR